VKFLTDENVFVPIVRELRALGHDVFDVKEQQLSGTKDPDIFKMAVEQERALITMDKDFSNIILYPPGSHFGIIVLKLYRLSVKVTTQTFMAAFEALDNARIRGNTIIIDKNKTRIRR